MNPLRAIRTGLWAAAVVAAVLAMAVWLGWWQETSRNDRLINNRSFQMSDYTGRSVMNADFEGKPSLMFFGFLSCPEICPTTLAEISRWLNDLGADADRLNVLFVTVVPKRDIPGEFAAYLSSFDPHIRGPSGTAAQLRAMSRNYGFFYAETPMADGDYTMQHTSSVFLLDANLQLVTTIDYHEDRKVVMPKLRRLLAS